MKHILLPVFYLLTMFGTARAGEFAKLDTLNGWYIPYDSVTYAVNKHSPSVMHYLEDGKYEAFGVTTKGLKWMYKGNWTRKNDTIFLFYDWSFDASIPARYMSELVESVPFGDTLIVSGAKLHYADLSAGIPPFRLVKWIPGDKDVFMVQESADRLMKFHSEDILKPAGNGRDMDGRYSWQGDAGQTIVHLKKNGKYFLWKSEGTMMRKEEGKWFIMGDTLYSTIREERLYYSTDTPPLRARKFRMGNVTGLKELKISDGIAEHHLYPVSKENYKAFKRRFRKAIHG